MPRILLVEDCDTQKTVTTKLLQRNGYEVIVAENSYESIEQAKSTSPDLVLMDAMPDADDATRDISTDSQTSHIPVVLMSPKSHETDKLWAERHGAKAYLVKPLDENVLINTIDNLI